MLLILRTTKSIDSQFQLGVQIQSRGGPSSLSPKIYLLLKENDLIHLSRGGPLHKPELRTLDPPCIINFSPDLNFFFILCYGAAITPLSRSWIYCTGFDVKDTHDIIFSETAEEIDFTAGGTKGHLRPSYMSFC